MNQIISGESSQVIDTITDNVNKYHNLEKPEVKLLLVNNTLLSLLLNEIKVLTSLLTEIMDADSKVRETSQS